MLSWIIKSVPRSPRAFLAFLVMLGSFWLTFSALQQLFVPGSGSTSKMALQFVVGLAIGLPATALFYFFQSIDDRDRHDRGESELDILNKYVDQDNRERIYRESKVTPVGHVDYSASKNSK